MTRILAGPAIGKRGSLRMRQRRFLRDQRRDAIEAMNHLCVDRMLDPQRAVLIEGDALLKRHKLRAGLVGGPADKVYDGFLRHPVVARRHWVLGFRGDGS
jgi:hypothetical protein